MRKLLLLVSRLYPNAWRERYGSEFAALLEDLRPRWTDLFDLVKGGLAMRLRLSNLPATATIGAFVGGITALGVTYAMPRPWRSTATVSFQTPDPARYPDTVAEFGHAAFSQDYFMEIIRKYNLYPEQRMRHPTEDVIQQAKEAARITVLRVGELSLSFAYPDPALSQRVTTDMADRLVEANIRNPQLLTHAFRIAIVQPPSRGVREAPNRRAIALAGVICGILVGIIATWVTRRRRVIVSS